MIGVSHHLEIISIVTKNVELMLRAHKLRSQRLHSNMLTRTAVVNRQPLIAWAILVLITEQLKTLAVFRRELLMEGLDTRYVRSHNG